MAYIDSTYITNRIGASLMNALAESDSARISAWCDDATALVQSALEHAGYASPSAPGDDVKLATFGQWLIAANALRIGVDIPAQWYAAVMLLDRIRKGEHKPIGLTPNTTGAVGGSEFSESDPTVAGNRAPVFTRDSLLF